MFNTLSHTNKFIARVDKDLPAAITKAASKQTYYTIYFLVDRDHVKDAYRAYAYFRWVDDRLDADSGTQQERNTFINRQHELLEACYRGESPSALSLEEQMLVDLVRNDKEKESGMRLYLRNMMDVMTFDVQRRGRLISQVELAEYSRLLSTAVTEALFYFIGHQDSSPRSATRYQAVRGAHVVHMLRDMVDDVRLGYFNIPAEIMASEQISYDDFSNLSMRKWVQERVKLACQYFQTGRRYIAQVKNLRSRLAGFTYLARFEWMLRAIERDQYYLRLEYPERKSIKAGLWMAWRVFTSLLNISWMNVEPGRQVVMFDQFEER